MDFWVFGYGSLVYEPECPEAVLDRVPARLDGVSRRLNKVSWARGCELDETDVPALPGWVDGTRRLSLAFGTVPGGSMDGIALRYDGAARERVLAGLRHREGCRPDVPVAEHHYAETPVDLGVAGGTLGAVTFLSIPGGPHARDLSDREVAEVLRHATPAGPYAGKRRGRHYVDALVDVLAVDDPWLDGILERLERL